MNLNYETVGINFNTIDKKGNKKADEISTPQNICDDMATLFDYTDCNRKIWMDMYCKTGNFLSSLKRQGVDKNNIAAICQTLQSQMLVCRKLYGKILPEVEVEIKIKSLESYKVTRRGQVYYISNWKDKVRYNYQEAYNIIKFVVMKEMERTMSLDWTTEDNFKINNIIMNPPYNPSDLYIDFVTLAKNIATESTVAITPAKFQAKGGEKNEAFRKDIVPYMSEIVYYKDSTNIFDIALSGGIAIYTVTNEVHNDKTVNSKLIENFDIDVPLDITDNELSILNKLSKEPKIIDRYKFRECKGYFISILPTVIEQGTGTDNIDTSSDIYLTDCTGRKIPIDKSKVKNIGDAYKYKLGISLHTFENGAYTSHIWEPNYIVGRNELILHVGTKEECEYADSFFGSKLIYWLSKRFFGSQTASSLSFRFVPDPGAFDHIFTDEELYQKYSLTPDEIAIIESVIKERK